MCWCAFKTSGPVVRGNDLQSWACRTSLYPQLLRRLLGDSGLDVDDYCVFLQVQRHTVGARQSALPVRSVHLSAWSVESSVPCVRPSSSVLNQEWLRWSRGVFPSCWSISIRGMPMSCPWEGQEEELQCQLCLDMTRAAVEFDCLQRFRCLLPLDISVLLGIVIFFYLPSAWLRGLVSRHPSLEDCVVQCLHQDFLYLKCRVLTDSLLDAGN